MQPIASALILTEFQQHEAWVQNPAGFAIAKKYENWGKLL
jgi:hypothetical protein